MQPTIFMIIISPSTTRLPSGALCKTQVRGSFHRQRFQCHPVRHVISCFTGSVACWVSAAAFCSHSFLNIFDLVSELKRKLSGPSIDRSWVLFLQCKCENFRAHS